MSIIFVPSSRDGCLSCNAKDGDPNTFVDLVGIKIGTLQLALCQDCSLALVETLLGRYYAIWGNGPLYDQVKKALDK